jgi:G3E family GTPase
VAQDLARLPVVLLSGFLGSGKTTLLNALLRRPALADTAVAINEFGEIALDQHLIARDEGDVLVLANGCLCCNLGGDAEEAVLRLFVRREQGGLPPFRRLIVEPSGLADPAPLAQAILRNPLMARVMRLSGIVGVIDAPFGARHLAEQPESAKQIAIADRIVLTKTDLADAAELRRQIAALNPLAPVLTATNGAIDPAALFAPDFLAPDLPSSADLPRSPRFAEAVTPHPNETGALILTHDAKLDWPRLETFLHETRLRHAEALLRLKGLVAIQGEDRPLLIQGVHHVLHPPVQLDSWPDTDHATRLVLILRGADPSPIRAAWAALTQAG